SRRGGAAGGGRGVGPVKPGLISRGPRSFGGTWSRHSGVVFAPNGGPKLRSKEMGLVFEFAFGGVCLPGCRGKPGRRAGVVSGRPRGVARRQHRNFRSPCGGLPTARLVAARSELLVATRHAMGRGTPGL